MRSKITSKDDYCIEWNGYCLDPNDVRNKYVKIEGTTYRVSHEISRMYIAV